MPEELGKVNVANEVVSSIAGIAVQQVPGVHGMSEKFHTGLAKMIRNVEATRGVKVEIGEQNNVAIDISIIAEMGHPLPTIASNIQRVVKEEVEKMTGLDVTEVNVHVESLVSPKPAKPAPKKPAEEKKESAKEKAT